jgi:hypothetical protein
MAIVSALPGGFELVQFRDSNGSFLAQEFPPVEEQGSDLTLVAIRIQHC